MRKMFTRIVFFVLVLVVLLVFGLAFLVNRLAKKGIETYGPEMTQVAVDLKSVNLSLLSGQGRINGLKVGNPPGYKTPSAIQANAISIDIKPTTLFADTLMIESMHIQNPEITVEGNLKRNNLQQILESIEAYTTDEKKTKSGKERKPPQKVQMDSLVLSGGKLHLNLTLLGSRTLTIPLPDIRLTDLGKEAGGITTAELTQKILTAIVQSATQSMSTAASRLGQELTDTAKHLGQDAIQGARKVLKEAGKGLKD